LVTTELLGPEVGEPGTDVAVPSGAMENPKMPAVDDPVVPTYANDTAPCALPLPPEPPDPPDPELPEPDPDVPPEPGVEGGAEPGAPELPAPAVVPPVVMVVDDECDEPPQPSISRMKKNADTQTRMRDFMAYS
jgi:hypothetical protein